MPSSYRLGLVGSGIELSLAPAFHKLAGRMLGLDIRYDLIPRDPSLATALAPFLDELAETGYRGVNVTVPFKALAGQAAAEPSGEVVATGVANTVLLGDGGPSHAFNTDFSGFKWAWDRRFGSAPPGVVALLGAGGVGSAAGAALVDLGATALRIYDVVTDRAHRLAGLLRASDGRVGIEVVASAEDAVDGVDGVVNGTPVGMSWNPGAPVELAGIGHQRWVFDAIYSPIETPLMAAAAAAGLARLTGLDLFLGQAIDAFEIFTGQRLSAPVITELESRIGTIERERGV